MSATLRRPPAVRPGDVVALVAPASPFETEEFDAGVAELAALGFNPEWHHDLFARQRYVAGPAATRAADFLRAWQDPRVAAVFAVRGGYGSAQIVSSLDPGTIRATPKALVGYSDVTTLLTYLVGHCGMVAFHGPTVAGRLGRGPAAYDRASLLAALTVAAPMGELALEGAETLIPGEVTGRLLGGTLTQLAAAAGTPYGLAPWDDTLLLLEDVGERPYRLDRLVQQVRDAGLLRRVRGRAAGHLPPVRRTRRRGDGPRGPGRSVCRLSGARRVRRADRPCRWPRADAAAGRAGDAWWPARRPGSWWTRPLSAKIRSL